MDLYLAEALTGHWIEQFERHIADCPDCAQELDQKRQLLEMLHNLSAPAPPEDLATRIKAAAQERLRQPIPQVRPAYAYYLRIAAACAVVVVAVSVGVVWRAPSARQALTPPAAPAEMTVAAQRQPSVVETSASPAAKTVLAKSAQSVKRGAVVASLPRRLHAESATPRPQPSAAAPVSFETSAAGESRTPELVEEKQETSGPDSVELSRAGGAQMMLTAEIRTARPPKYLVQAAPRVDSGTEPSLAKGEPAETVQAELVGRTLVGTVVANAVVSQYVRDAIIESDKTMMALTTSAPASLIEVTATNGEVQTE